MIEKVVVNPQFDECAVYETGRRNGSEFQVDYRGV